MDSVTVYFANERAMRNFLAKWCERRGTIYDNVLPHDYELELRYSGEDAERARSLATEVEGSDVEVDSTLAPWE